MFKKIVCTFILIVIANDCFVTQQKNQQQTKHFSIEEKGSWYVHFFLYKQTILEQQAGFDHLNIIQELYIEQAKNML